LLVFERWIQIRVSCIAALIRGRDLVPMSNTPKGDDFPSTQWSLIARAGGKEEAARGALAELCKQYWYPVYSFFRRRSASVEAAEDLTQGFFAQLLDGRMVAGADESHGRFRAYLIGCCRNYLVDQLRRDGAKKRGGNARRVPIDLVEAEARFRREPAATDDPERQFLRNWAFTLIEQTAAAVRREYADAGRTDLFDRLRSALCGDTDSDAYRSIGKDLGLSENAVKKAAQELRRRYGAELRHRIRQTVVRTSEVEDEIRELFAVVAG
jgi:RNA polymerase sigma-70 factor (ECF subfamily)